jgi:hypothetical protein
MPLPTNLYRVRDTYYFRTRAIRFGGHDSGDIKLIEDLEPGEESQMSNVSP